MRWSIHFHTLFYSDSFLMCSCVCEKKYQSQWYARISSRMPYEFDSNSFNSYPNRKEYSWRDSVAHGSMHNRCRISSRSAQKYKSNGENRGHGKRNQPKLNEVLSRLLELKNKEETNFRILGGTICSELQYMCTFRLDFALDIIV